MTESDDTLRLANGEFECRQPSSGKDTWRMELHGDLKFDGKLIEIDSELGRIVFRLTKAELQVKPVECWMRQSELGYSRNAFSAKETYYEGKHQTGTVEKTSLKQKLGISFSAAPAPFPIGEEGAAYAGASSKAARSKDGTKVKDFAATDRVTGVTPHVICVGIEDDGLARFQIEHPIPLTPLKGDVFKDETDGRLGTVHGNPGANWSVDIQLRPVIRFDDIDWQRTKFKSVMKKIFGKASIDRHWRSTSKENLALILLSKESRCRQKMRFLPPHQNPARVTH